MVSFDGADPAKPEVTEDTQIKVACTAAEIFVESYYPALNNPSHRSKITSFYVKPSSTSPLQVDICLNGNILSDAAQIQSFFETQISRTDYQVGSYDAHVINTNFNVGAEESHLQPQKDGNKMSVLVVVSGSVKYWKEGADSETRGFMENFVLVPNWDAHKPNAAKGEKKWLVQTQTFRLVV